MRNATSAISASCKEQLTDEGIGEVVCLTGHTGYGVTLRGSPPEKVRCLTERDALCYTE